MSYREQGKQALRSVILQEQNIRVIETNIHVAATDVAKTTHDIEDTYRDIIYQIVGDIFSDKPLKQILMNIKERKVGWDHINFTEWRLIMREQDDFVENPFEVAEGVLECNNILKSGKKCGSKRVFSYTKQVRSCDEGCTTFATCCKCGAKWQHKG